MKSLKFRPPAFKPADGWLRTICSTSTTAPFSTLLQSRIAQTPTIRETHPPFHTRRAFSSTPAVLKSGPKQPSQGKRKSPKQAEPAGAASPSSTGGGGPEENDAKHPTASSAEPLNLDDVKSRLSSLETHYREALKKFQAGSRFNPAVIGALAVQPDRASRATFPLRELAEIVPRGGRTVSLLVHDRAYVKPIISAVQASDDFNQQPQRDPDNELALTLRVEPERRDEQAARLKTLTQQWRDRVRQVRARREKQTDHWVKEKSVLVDVGAKVGKSLAKMQDDVFKEIERLEKQILKQLEQAK